MAIYVVQGNAAPTGRPVVMGATGVVIYELTSAADGTELTGSGDMLSIISDAADGWLHVSTTVATDKAGSKKSHRIQTDIRYELGGVASGMFVSFLADA